MTPQKTRENDLNSDRFYSIQQIEIKKKKQKSMLDKFTCLGSYSKADQEEVVTSGFKPINIQNHSQINDEFVWYAAYDHDMKTSNFVESMQKIIGPEFQPFEVAPVQIKGWQVCFDTAISDAPFVCKYRPDSPNTQKMKLLKEDFSQPTNGVFTLLYLLRRADFETMLKHKCQCESSKKDPDLEIGLKLSTSGGYRLKQFVNYDQIDKYIITKKGISTIPEDTMDYLDFNCAFRVPFIFQNFSVFFVSNDASYNHYFLNPKDKYTMKEDETHAILNEKLYGMRRLQVFKRISHRAGLASFNTRKTIQGNHKKLVTDMYYAIQEHFPEMSDLDVQTHLENCQGIKFSNISQLANPQAGDDLS